MTLSDIVLIVFVIQINLVATMTFGSIAWSMFEDTNVGAEISEWIISKFKGAPTVDAEPVRHGKWIRDEFGAKCGACGLYAYRDKFDQPWESPYCPNCGARMEEQNDNN